MNNIEIEVKILLQSEENKSRFLSALQSHGGLIETGKNSQLNHYFSGGDLHILKGNISAYLDESQKQNLDSLMARAKSFSARTRKSDDRVIFVLKASIDETNSINGTGRLEFEVDMPLSIDELDQIFLDSGFSYETKWSRDRVEYQYGDYVVCLDQNSGYGWLAELERVVTDESQLETIKTEIRDEISVLGFSELPQDRVNRMYQHYVHVWPHYYGTRNWFNVE